MRDRRLIETEADLANDMQSIYRACERKLYLIVKGDHGWQLPTVSLTNEDGNLRNVFEGSILIAFDLIAQAAERASDDTFNDPDLHIYFLGNTPSVCVVCLLSISRIFNHL